MEVLSKKIPQDISRKTATTEQVSPKVLSTIPAVSGDLIGVDAARFSPTQTKLVLEALQ